MNRAGLVIRRVGLVNSNRHPISEQNHELVECRLIEEIPKNSAESFRDTDIETLNREHSLVIDTDTCVSLWDGTRMNHALAVEQLHLNDYFFNHLDFHEYVAKQRLANGWVRH